MKSTLHRLFATASVAVSLLLAPALKATPLLTAAYEAQLEAWLGQGDLIFTNVFTKQGGDDTSDFHAAADGKGATFLLMNIYGRGTGGSYVGTSELPSQIIGGYNPQSWSSTNGFNLTNADAERTGFLYNLSNSTIQRQNLNGEGASGSGQYQVYNGGYYGPIFGGGPHDIALYDNSLNFGYVSNYSYGGTSSGDEIVTGGPNYYAESVFNVGELEVWTFTPAASSVPDTSGTIGLLSVSLLALAAVRRRVVAASA